MSLDTLRNRFGGSWDGTDRERHGLIDHHGTPLKLELLRSSSGWLCSVFVAGQCESSARHESAEEAVDHALRALEHHE